MGYGYNSKILGFGFDVNYANYQENCSTFFGKVIFWHSTHSVYKTWWLKDQEPTAPLRLRKRYQTTPRKLTKNLYLEDDKRGHYWKFGLKFRRWQSKSYLVPSWPIIADLGRRSYYLKYSRKRRPDE